VTSAPAAARGRAVAGVDAGVITCTATQAAAEIEQAVGAGWGTSWSTPSRRSPGWPTTRRRPGARPRVLVRVTTEWRRTRMSSWRRRTTTEVRLSLASGAADEAVRRVLGLSQLEFAGLHSHIGSQIFDTSGFEVAAHRVLELAAGSTPSTACTWPSSTWAAGSASPTCPRTTPRGEDPGGRAARDRGVPVPGLGIRYQADDRAWPRHHRAVHRDPLRGRTIKDVDGIRTYVSVDRRDERQRPHALYERPIPARSRRAPRPRADAVPRGGQAL